MDYATFFERIVQSYWGVSPKSQISFTSYYDKGNKTFGNAYELKSILLAFCIYEVNYEENNDEEKAVLDNFLNGFQTMTSYEVQNFIAFLYNKKELS